MWPRWTTVTSKTEERPAQHTELDQSSGYKSTLTIRFRDSDETAYVLSWTCEYSEPYTESVFGEGDQKPTWWSPRSHHWYGFHQWFFDSDDEWFQFVYSSGHTVFSRKDIISFQVHEDKLG